MKTKKVSILFLVLFGVIISAKAQTISITLSNPIAKSNMDFLVQPDPNDEPYTIQTTKSGQACREIPAGKYAYFKTTNSSIATTDRNLIVRITYFDEGTGSLQFQYNSATSDHQTQNVAKTGTNTWLTAVVALKDASFRQAQRGANGWDFRIGGVNYISQITITKGSLNPENEPTVPVQASAYSEFLGKSVAGYQCWFETGNATSGWFHWNHTSQGQPAVGNLKFEIYPDISEYDNADLAATGFANFGNGQPAKLFNSANASVINRHFDWMKTYGIDGAAVQRFINGIGSAINNSPASHLVKIKNAAEANNRIFYICYDISSTGLDATWADIIKFDWVYNVEQAYELTQSPAYAKVGNKPVVQIWGTGFTDNHPGTAQETIALINFLKSRGCYVIGGVPTWWRTETGDSKPNFLAAYNAYDMLSPWFVGRFSDNADADNKYNNPMLGDKAYCDSKGIAYMPVLFPGFAWSQWNTGSPNTAPRNAGDFMWHQAYNIKNLGVKNMYFAMFDEYDEGTAIMKAATDWTEIPTDQYFLTTSADGYWLSSDFQLRTAGAAIEMLKGTRAQTATNPVPHSAGKILYRNNFESRTTGYNYVNNVAQGSGTFPLDPCFKNPAQVSVSNVNNQETKIITFNNAKTGNYVAQIKGNATANDGFYWYKIADVKILLGDNAKISFSKYPLNQMAHLVSVGLKFSDETTRFYSHGSMVSLNQWADFEYPLSDCAGKTVSQILLKFENAMGLGGVGSFDCYFDNFLIENDETATPPAGTPTYPAGYPKTQAMTNPLFWQFGSPKVDAAGTLTAEMGNLYTADPSARVWNIDGVPTLFVYASHDMEQAAGCDRMDRYHIFSTTDMTNWTDYGEFLKADDVPWHNGSFVNGSKFMWAPDAAYKNGKYYFYFPHPSQNSGDGAGSWGNNWKIGVAVSDFPASDFTVLPAPLNLNTGYEYDPCVFVDDDGKAYLYYGGGSHPYVVKLKDNMTETDGTPQVMQGLDNFHEGAWVHKRDGKYYLSYPDNGGGGAGNGDQLKYAMSDSPMGPWESKGAYLYATGCGTIHGSIVEYKGQWYAFYHSDYISNNGDQGRSVHFDPLYYNADGTIQVVKNWGEPYNGVHNVVATNSTADIALTLQAEDFNTGGETYGYHDRKAQTTQNTNYRTVAGVVIEDRNNGKTIGDIESKEFLRYTINVAAAGLYDIDVWVASENANGKFHLNVNGVNKSGSVSVPNTTGWGTFQKVTATNIPLRAGENLFSIYFENGGFNLDKFDFRRAAPYAGTPYKTHNIPCRVEAEDYDYGCQGIAYFDNDGQNNGYYAYRTDCTGNLVDLENSNGSIHIAWTAAGEWTKYTLNAPQAGVYDIKVRVSTGNGAGGSLRLVFDDVDEYELAAQTASWGSYAEFTVPNVSLAAGKHIMKMEIGGNINVDYYEFVLKPTTGTAQVEAEKIRVYPNPTSGVLRIDNYELSIMNYELRDLSGRTVHSQLLNGNSIDISHLSPGVYFLRIDGQTVKVVRK